MDKFLGTYNLPKVNYEEIENLTRLFNSKEFESIIQNFLINKIQEQMASLVNSTKHSKTELIPIFFKFLQKNRRVGTFSKLAL